MTTKYEKNKKYALKWIENNREQYNEIRRTYMKRPMTTISVNRSVNITN